MAESTITASTAGTSTSLLVASVTLSNTPASGISTGSEAAKFLKPDSPRKRRRSVADLSSPTDTASLRASPLPISPKRAFPHYHSRPLTGAAAMADGKRQREEDEMAESRRTSPNPARNAITALLGTQSSDSSKPQNVTNAATTMSEPVAAVATSIKVPELSQGDNTLQTSPVSMSSGGTSESTTVGAMNTNGASVASPSQIDESLGDEDETSSRHIKNGIVNSDTADAEEGRSNKAMTFPGPLLSAQVTDARRGMSLPHSGLGSPRSPSTAKKHKCPYCSTDFTRHHNLKSHLLTHSHEKPYLCGTCDSRFRRLHDLKRHTKLHTGERPHVCPKCDRSFARGDALARHNKGQGGCAGRRSSMGSFGGDDKSEGRRKSTGQDDSMPGLIYSGEASHEPERMDDDSESIDARGTSLPRIRQHDVPSEPHHRQRLSESHSAYQPRQPSTYPPVAARQPSGGLYPPSASHGGGGSSASTTPGAPGSLNQYPLPAGSGSSTFQPPGSNVFAQGGMTESPRPLSPGGHPDSGAHPNRSPSLTQQFQQQQYGRRPNTHNTSPQMGLPPPITGPNHQNVPHLPSLPGLTPPEPRFTLHSQATGPQLMHPGPQSSLPGPVHPISGGGMGSPGYHSQVGNNTSSANNSLSSHGTGPHASGDHSIYVAGNSDRLWAYVRSLETKVDRLQDEVTTLKSQLNPPPPHR